MRYRWLAGLHHRLRRGLVRRKPINASLADCAADDRAAVMGFFAPEISTSRKIEHSRAMSGEK